jgi:hypothetical protein
MGHNQIQTPHLPQHTAQHAELGAPVGEFLPFENARELVADVMWDRVDHSTGELLPLTEKQTPYNMPGSDQMMEPTLERPTFDYILPPVEHGDRELIGGGAAITEWGFHTGAIIYDSLVGKEDRNLTAAEAARVAEDQARLRHTLDARQDIHWGVNADQNINSYRIFKNDTPEPQTDNLLAAPTRVYVDGELVGPAIVTELIDRGIDFADIKAWAMRPTEQLQEIRHDAAIITANTAEQLDSIVQGLRILAQERPELFANTEPLMGIPVAGVPGAYIGQTQPHQSFNSEMSHLWEKAMVRAANEIPLGQDFVVDDTWIDKTAQRTIEIAQEEAVAAGRNPQCHAAILDQDPEVLYAIAAA